MTDPAPEAFFNLAEPHPDMRFEAVRREINRVLAGLQTATDAGDDLKVRVEAVEPSVTAVSEIAEQVQALEATVAELQQQIQEPPL